VNSSGPAPVVRPAVPSGQTLRSSARLASGTGRAPDDCCEFKGGEKKILGREQPGPGEPSRVEVDVELVPAPPESPK